MKRIVDQQDLDLNPELVDQGVEIGEEIELGAPCNEDGTPISTDDAASVSDVIGDGTRPTKGPK